MRYILLALALLVAACAVDPSPLVEARGAPDPVTPLPSPRLLQIDFAGAQPIAGLPLYDGDHWVLDHSSIRVPLHIEAGSTILGWFVYGRHDSVDGQYTLACLQRLETVLVDGAVLHRDVSCARADALTQDAFTIEGPPGTLFVTDDDVLSMRVFGHGLGDRVGAASVVIQPPAGTR